MKPEQICKLIGHRLDVDACHYYAINQCRRCEKELLEPLPYEHLMVRFHMVRRWISDRLHWWTHLFERCPECGLRFHRHDDRFDHLPF